MENRVELGSEYNISLDQLSIKNNNLFHCLSQFKNTLYFDSGRSALKHVVQQLEEDTIVLLPEFICESVIKCFHKLKKITFYKIKNDFTIDIDDFKRKANARTKVFFIMHYFGAVQPEEVLQEIKRIANFYNSIIIEDTTHSFFSNSHTIGDYMVCSLRKWMPIPQGGVLYFENNKANVSMPHYEQSQDNQRAYGMILKDLYLKTGGDYNNTYRNIFARAETVLNNQDRPKMMSDLCKFLISCVDIGELISTRRRNYKTVKNYFKEWGVTSPCMIHEENCPLVFLLRVKNRDVLKTFLINNRIYCAVHWPFDGFKAEERQFAKELADQLISLPIDQRYSDEDMEFLIGIMKKYGGTLTF